MKLKNIVSNIVNLGFGNKTPAEQTDLASLAPSGAINSQQAITQSERPDPDENCVNRKSNIANSSTPHSNGPNRRRTGKVARLPRRVRFLVNLMLDAGYTYKSIVAALAEIGFPGFFEQNIQRWKDAGYQDHLEFLERMQARALASDPTMPLTLRPKLENPAEELAALLASALTGSVPPAHPPESDHRGN